MQQAHEAEPIYFQDQQCFVSRSRVVLGGTVYPVNAISSVRRAYKSRPAILWVAALGSGIVGAFFLLMGILAEHDNALALVPGGLAFIVGGAFYAFYRSFDEWYFVVLATTGKDVHALTSADRGYVDAVVSAINNAIAAFATPSLQMVVAASPGPVAPPVPGGAATPGATRKCPGCGSAAPGSGRFCKHCSAELSPSSCAHCGATNDPDARFCVACRGALGAPS